MDAFTAIADPIRRQIITKLAAAEQSAGDIGAAFAITASAVSQHLKALKQAGLVRVRVEGQRRLYRLDSDRFREIQEWLVAPASPRRSTATISTFCDATDLDSWANRRDAQALLPAVTRRLIFATTSDLTRIGFRAGDGVQLGGCDGVVVTESSNAFVPTGISVWELSANQNPRRKADQDYVKRTDNPDGVEPTQTAFIFLTPRRWAGKAAWAAVRQAEGVWREVRVYDADDIETWLELAPGVHIWLSIQLGTHPNDATDLESVWEDWSQATNPPITTTFMLAGRTEAAAQVRAWLLDRSDSTLALQAESREEAIALFAAVVLQLPDDERQAVLGRIIVVDTAAAFNTLTLSGESLVLIPRYEDDQAIGRARRKGHRVLVPLGIKDTGTSAVIAPRLARQEAQQALRVLGIPEDRVIELVTLARRSMMSFRRATAVRPELRQPHWAHGADTRSLLAALLIGAWKDSSAADRAIIEALSRHTYEETIDKFDLLIADADPPIQRVGDVWQVVSREDMWMQLSHYLRRDDVKRFKDVVLEVLGPVDPRFALPPEERWMANVRGQVRPHSGLLCEGIAQTLALMGTRGAAINISGLGTLRDVACHVVRDLLERANRDAQVWLSLARLLPLLAEAAPDEFLRAVEVGLTGDHPLVLDLFVEESSPFFGSSEHTGLLWALEILSWSPEYLSRATLALAKLARLDPGGNLRNRPEATLRRIFLPWFPQTSAPVEERLRVIDCVRGREPEIAWRLLQQLLPEFHSMEHGSAKPRWREWAPDSAPKVTRRGLDTVYKAVLDRMLEDVGNSGARWQDLIGALGVLSPDQCDEIVRRLDVLNPADLHVADRQLVSNALRKLLSRHRTFPDAEWALRPERLESLARIYERLIPEDLIGRYAWLFSDDPELVEGGEHDWDVREQAVAAARLTAVETAYAQDGISGVLGFFPHVERAFCLGRTLGRSVRGDAEEDALLHQHLANEAKANINFARGFIVGRLDQRGMPWAEAKLRGAGVAWSAQRRGEFIAALPNNAAVWDLVDSTDFETQRVYWCTMQPWGIEGEDAERVVRHLLQCGRPYSAIDVLASGRRRQDPMPQTLIADALELAARTDPKTDVHFNSLSYRVGKLLDGLTPNDEIDVNRIAQLEWAFLPLLSFDRSPKFLHDELGRNPKFFADIINFVFCAEGEEPREASKEEQARALHGHELLESWRSVPGMTDGVIDAEALSTWVQRAREFMQESRRGEIGDQMIGKALSGSPQGADGAWPAEAVRDIIETVASDDLEQGFEIGQYNSRGVVSRDPAEGGGQERQLAKRYEKHAEVARDRWPRTAAMLRRLAGTYRTDARQVDDQSELMGRLDA